MKWHFLRIVSRCLINIELRFYFKKETINKTNKNYNFVRSVLYIKPDKQLIYTSGKLIKHCPNTI